MNPPRPHACSAYMEFSKSHSAARYNLATSGVMNCSLGELALEAKDMASLQIHGPSDYGYRPLLEAIAGIKGVPAECVVTAQGTAMANHLAMSALFAPGDEVLIEEPTYELILTTALYLGATVGRFQRRAEDNYALNLAEIEKYLTPRTRLIVMTNMHNPSSALASQEQIKELGQLAATVGARVLVDEVYLEILPQAPSSFHLGPQFVATGSLTKAYGLSGLRCGWILAEPELARHLWRLNDLFAATPVFLAEQLSVLAIARLDALRARGHALIDVNRAALRELLGDHPGLRLTIPSVGTTAFPRLLEDDGPGFCAFLRDRYETSVVPGAYFERPQHFRIGLAGDPALTREGLGRLAHALHAWAANKR